MHRASMKAKYSFNQTPNLRCNNNLRSNYSSNGHIFIPIITNFL